VDRFKRLAMLISTLIACQLLPNTPEAAGGPTLVRRYRTLSCAVVRIMSDKEQGTGFFVTGNGVLVTAAHVIYDKTYHKSGEKITLSIAAKTGLRIVTQGNKTVPLNVPIPTDDDIERAGMDLAVIDMPLTTNCFIPVVDKSDKELSTVSVGQHVIAIGFPGLAVSSVLYDGMISAVYLRPPIPVGQIENQPGTSAIPRYPVMQVQMPVTPGASGSPIITDENRVVGVMSELPVIWPIELKNASGDYQLQKSIPDGTRTIDGLAWFVSSFESPGFGLAVPTFFVHLRPNPEPATSTRPKPAQTVRPPQ